MSDVLKNNNIELGKQTGKLSQRIADLKRRKDRCVCRYCGSKLSLRKMTYAAYDETKIDIFCDSCNRLEQGVEPEIYIIAEYYVDEMGYDYYPELEPSERKRRMNIAVVCDILAWGYRSIGILDKDGFKIELDFKEELISRSLAINDKVLNLVSKEG